MKQYEVGWHEIFERIAHLRIDQDVGRVYGVPRGGMICSGFLRKAVNVYRPEDADVILDDVIDSGKTRDEYKIRFPDKPFVALFDKTKGDKDIGWLIFPWEKDDEGSIDDATIRLLQFIGEDPSREGLRETPRRVARAWRTLTRGYRQNPEHFMTTFVEGACDEMVILRDIELYSICEHHLMPFFGKAHVAYIPDGKVIGISKLARLVDVFARRLQIQERIGDQVTEAIMKHLKPLGAACVIEAQHLCMMSRGIQKQHSSMITSSLRGVFREKSEARAELMGLIRS